MTDRTKNPIRIAAWRAKRSGARITIEGRKRTTGEAIKVAVDAIDADIRGSIVVATDHKTAQLYILEPSP